MTDWYHHGDNITQSGGVNIGKVDSWHGQFPASPMTEEPPSNMVWTAPVVFVNYRNADEKAAADLEVELTRRLGRGAVFRDVRMAAGVEFPRELADRARGCAVMLSVIGERWDDAHGLRLLADHADWVRLEIRTALAHQVQVVPVLVGARGRLSPHDLPRDIRQLAYLQTPHLRRGYDTRDVRQLVDDLLRDLPVLTEAMRRR